MTASLRLLRLLTPIVLTGTWAWFIYRVSSATIPPGIGADGTSILDFLPRSDLWVHAGVYAFLAWFFMLSVLPIRFCKPINVALHYAMPVIIAGVYGIAMEWVQDTIPERSAEAIDVVADIVGAVLAVAFMIIIWPRIKRFRRSIASIL